MPLARLRRQIQLAWTGNGSAFRKAAPMMPPTMMAPICPHADGMASAIAKAATARLARPRSGVRRPRHAEDGKRHDRHRGDLQSVQPAAAQRVAGCRKSIGEHDQRESRWKREGGPGGKCAGIARPQQTDRDSDLAGGGTRQELAQRNQIGVSLLLEPFAAFDELVAEIAEMGDGTAERRQAQLQKDREDLAGAALWSVAAHCETPALVVSISSPPRRIRQPGRSDALPAVSGSCGSGPGIVLRYREAVV